MRTAVLNRMLRDEVSVASRGAVDQYGQPTMSDPVTVKARVQFRQSRSVDPSGVEFISTTQVVTTHPIRVGDILTVDGQERVVRAVQSARGLRGDGVTLVEARL